MSPFCGDTDTPVLDFWTSKPEWAALFVPWPPQPPPDPLLVYVLRVTGVCVTCPLRITSGVTPADLWQSTWQLSCSLPHTCEQAFVELETWTYHATAHSVRPGRQTLYRVSFAGSATLTLVCNYLWVCSFS